MRNRGISGRRRQPAHSRSLGTGWDRGSSYLFGPRTGNGDVPGHTFLKQELSGLYYRFTVEPSAHLAIVKGIRNGNDSHALVMGHEAAYDDEGLAIGQPRSGKIDGFVEAVATAGSHLRQAFEVQPRTVRLHHGGKTRCIGRYHHILRESPLQTEPWNAEVGILVGEFDVPGIVGRLRDAPRNAQRPPIRPLPLHRQTTGLLEQAADRRAHHQRRHQILEHGSGPGDQRRSASDRCRGPAEVKPVSGRNVSLRNRKQTGEPCFRSEQVVAAGVEAIVDKGVTNRKLFPLRIKEKCEIHGERHRARGVGERFQPALKTVRCIGDREPVTTMFGHGLGQGLGPENQIRSAVFYPCGHDAAGHFGGLFSKPLQHGQPLLGR